MVKNQFTFFYSFTVKSLFSFKRAHFYKLEFYFRNVKLNLKNYKSLQNKTIQNVTLNDLIRNVLVENENNY